MAKKTIKKLFIANRGEISRRIAITAKRMGITTVAVTERTPPPAFLLDVIDQFVQVEEESAALFLNMETMVNTAVSSGCDAVHPGFGFLSENDAFADAVQDAGLIWVGPNPDAIRSMASKSMARDIANKSNMPCIEGLQDFNVPEDENGDFSQLLEFARKTEYPLLIKASYGGGGKGMRRVEAEEGLREAALRARSEAINSFGNGALICERYLTNPRHVEVQILADHHGTVCAIGDRDCSLQRRHQKIVEEAPAPDLSPETRAAMHDAAVKLAQTVGYDSTGTVEFMVDWSEKSKKAKKHRFYFLEMNTRLQVEHPVSEEVFGIDLVEWQLKVAMGAKLPAEFKKLEPRGHSIEARIYAEDTAAKFMPAPGPVVAFSPAQGGGIRWELGIDAIDEISTKFDPMIAKLVVTATDRPAALQLLAETIDRSLFAGPPSNFDLLNILSTRTDFAEGPVTTAFLGDEFDNLVSAIEARQEKQSELASTLLNKLKDNQIGLGGVTSGASALTISNVTESAFSAQVAKKTEPGAGGDIVVSTETVSQDPWKTGHQTRMGKGYAKDSDGMNKAFCYAIHKNPEAKEFWIQLGGCHFSFIEKAASWSELEAGHGSDNIVAPVPGKVIAIKVGEGDAVTEGQTVFILESMKMEFEVKAPKDGSIGGILVAVGDQLTTGTLLTNWAEEAE